MPLTYTHFDPMDATGLRVLDREGELTPDMVVSQALRAAARQIEDGMTRAGLGPHVTYSQPGTAIIDYVCNGVLQRLDVSVR